LKGKRLGTPAELATTARLAKAQVKRYGRTDTVYLAEIRCLWYGSFHTQRVRVILLRDDATDTGYDLALVTTDPTATAADLITRYAWRRSIEITFEEARGLLGVGQARNRTQRAVERTGPFDLQLQHHRHLVHPARPPSCGRGRPPREGTVRSSSVRRGRIGV
jgi:hypothetical protein